jgi:hypothetical protein
MNKTIYIRRNSYYHGELYGVSILFKFSTIDDMTLYVTAQLQKQTTHSRVICRGHYTDIFTWFFLNIQGWLSLHREIEQPHKTYTAHILLVFGNQFFQSSSNVLEKILMIVNNCHKR